MAALQEVEALIARLNRAEKAQLLRSVVRDLGDDFPGIGSMPGVSGGEVNCRIGPMEFVAVSSNQTRASAGTRTVTWAGASAGT